MKNFIFTISLIIILLFYCSSLFAHKEWVHQYQVRQAYLLLKQQQGFDIATLYNHLGFNHNGQGPGPFLGCSIVQGAWEEDLYDPIWEVGGLMLGPWSYCGWDASSTHFWNADAGDYSTINIPMDLNNCPLPDGEIPNAYWKAMYYIYGGWVIKWKPYNGYTFTASNGHTYRFEKEVLEYPMVVTFYYNSLIDLYKNGNIVFVLNPKSNFRIYNVTIGRYVWISGNFPIPNTMRNLFVWEILGRTAHLLGDMSVPAHVKNDVHPCNVQIPLNSNGTIYNEGDTFELYLGGLVGGSNPHCNDPQSVFPAQNINWTDALNQGGFIDVFGKENPIRYLFYTTNQLADHFGSLSTKENPSFDPQRWYPGDNNYSLNFGEDYYQEFQQLISTMGSPITNINDFPPSIIATTNTAFVYSIRAIAGLFHWFAKECDILYAPVVAPIISHFTQAPNPIYKGSTGSVTCNLQQGNGNLTYQWTGNHFPTGATFTPNGNKVIINYNYNRVASLDMLRTDYNNREIRVPEPTLTCTVTNGAGSSTSTYVVHLINQPNGGCPFVYTWDGESWVEDNNILPQSQIPGNEEIDVTDYYQLYTTPIEQDGKYYLAVGEFENEISNLDKLQLLLIDHPEDTYITVDDEGNIIQFAKPSFFANASLDSADVYKQLYEQDGNIAEVSEGDTLELMFEDAEPDTDQWLLLIANIKAHVAKKEIAGKLLDKNRNTFSTFRLRKNPSYQWAMVPASGTTTMELGVYWENDAEIDYAELSRVLELPFDSHTAELLSAEHSVRGDVLDKLLLQDEDYAELQPNEWISLEYNSPPIPSGKIRSFIFISKGRYQTLIDTSWSKSIAKVNSDIEEMGYEYALFQNYPNPFNPSTVIKYQIKEAGEVTIKLYDVLGNEVYTLVNEYKEKGLYEVNFNSSVLSSGVYFCIIKSKEFTASRKMILMR